MSQLILQPHREFLYRGFPRTRHRIKIAYGKCYFCISFFLNMLCLVVEKSAGAYAHDREEIALIVVDEEDL